MKLPRGHWRVFLTSSRFLAKNPHHVPLPFSWHNRILASPFLLSSSKNANTLIPFSLSVGALPMPSRCCLSTLSQPQHRSTSARLLSSWVLDSSATFEMTLPKDLQISKIRAIFWVSSFFSLSKSLTQIFTACSSLIWGPSTVSGSAPPRKGHTGFSPVPLPMTGCCFLPSPAQCFLISLLDHECVLLAVEPVFSHLPAGTHLSPSTGSQPKSVALGS